MTKQTETRSIAEVIRAGDGRYEELIGVDKLRDGTYLVYEKTPLFGFLKGSARVHRLDSEKKIELSSAVIGYFNNEAEYTIIRRLNDVILPIKE